MARNKSNQPNIDNSNLANYPNGRIKDNDGSGNGTAVNEAVYGDIHETFAKMMRLYGIPFNDVADNETTGYQYIEALRALASKNDFILNIGESAGKLTVPVKLGAMLPDEQIVCKAIVNKGSETQIVGSDGISRTIASVGAFKTGEYVRLINTASTVVLVRMVDSVNVDTVINELSYLKAATLAQELAGASDSVATTPLTNILAFAERVNGADSNASLAIANVRNGLLSKEDKYAIDNFADPSSLIIITKATDVVVAGWANGYQNNNFNFNYVDITPPTGKTMNDLQGFMCSQAEGHFAGNVDGNDSFWCKYRIESTKIRVICGMAESRAPARVNWQAIWI